MKNVSIYTLLVVLLAALGVGYYLGNLSNKDWKNEYMDYCIYYRTCVNSNTPEVAEHCGREAQLHHPKLFVK